MNTRIWLAGALALAYSASAPAAGGVQAEIDPVTFDLKITGDTSDNDIAITSGGAFGAYTVTGVNGTTVNGAATADFTDVRGIVLQMGAGADRVVISDVLIRGQLRGLLDAGNDTLQLNGVRVHGRTAIRGDQGNDRVIATANCVFRGPFTFRGTGDNDEVSVRDSAFLNRFRLDMGTGDDKITMENCYYSDNARVEIECRFGDDDAELLDCTFNNDVFVDMGPDDDHLTLEDSNYNEDGDFSGGGGNDDNLETDSDNNFDHFPGFHSFEH